MAGLFSNYFCLLLLITTHFGFILSSCAPDTVGSCGCCENSTTECIIIPSNIIPSFPSYEKYICVSKFSVPTFSLNKCNCTAKDPAFCVCSNQYSKVYPVYSTCYSFTECIINDIKVGAQQKIRGKRYLFRIYRFVICFLFSESVCKKAVRFTGRCSDNYLRRFYYNWSTNRCESFIYSGCPTNRFTFITKDFCEEVCKF